MRFKNIYALVSSFCLLFIVQVGYEAPVAFAQNHENFIAVNQDDGTQNKGQFATRQMDSVHKWGNLHKTVDDTTSEADNVFANSLLPLKRVSMISRFYTSYDFNTKSIFLSGQQTNEKVAWKVPTMQFHPNQTLYVPILCYHVVSDGKASTMYTPYWVFEEHLKTLKDSGYTAITPQQLYEAYYLNKELPPKPIMITFDDGYYDNYSLGYPLLKKYNMQATIFVIASLIEEQQNESATGGLPRLSWENIRAMASYVTVQSHTFNSHSKAKGPNGREVGMIATPIIQDGQWETETQYWIRLGRDFLATEKLLKEKVGYGSYIFSYPYGQHSNITKKVLAQMEIPLAVTIRKGVAKSTSDAYAIPRIIVDGNWSGQQLLSQLY